jgi:putative transposase
LVRGKKFNFFKKLNFLLPTGKKPMYISGSYYHIYNHGVNREPIFYTSRNWGFFLHRLREYFTPERAEIVAYCLMPNHYHLLVQVKAGDFSQEVMHPFSISYTKAINKEQGRVGALFQGRFKGKLIEKDEYLLHLSRYIHLNPVRVGLVSRPEDWEYSSYRDFVGLRQGTLPRPEIVLGQFGSAKDYAKFVEEFKGEDETIRALWLD